MSCADLTKSPIRVARTSCFKLRCAYAHRTSKSLRPPALLFAMELRHRLERFRIRRPERIAGMLRWEKDFFNHPRAARERPGLGTPGTHGAARAYLSHRSPI